MYESTYVPDATFDAFDTPATAGGGCCCGPVTDPGWDNTWTAPVEPPLAPPAPPVLDGSDLFSPPPPPPSEFSGADLYQPPPPPPFVGSGPVGGDASAVMGLGQPGSASATADLQDLLYPSTMTIGGDPISNYIHVDPMPGTVNPSMAVIGGDPIGNYIHVDPTGTSVATPGTMVIGPPAPGSYADNMASLWGVAAANGDIMSQALLLRTMDSMRAATSIWLV